MNAFYAGRGWTAVKGRREEKQGAVCASAVTLSDRSTLRRATRHPPNTSICPLISSPHADPVHDHGRPEFITYCYRDRIFRMQIFRRPRGPVDMEIQGVCSFPG